MCSYLPNTYSCVSACLECGLGAWGNEVREARMMGPTSSSISCQLCWSEWLPRWDLYYNARSISSPLLCHTFHPTPWHNLGSSISQCCNYSLDNLGSCCLLVKRDGTTHLYEHSWPIIQRQLDTLDILASVWFTSRFRM